MAIAPIISFSLSIGTLEKRPNAALLDSGDEQRIALDVGLLCRNVGNMHDLLGPGGAGEAGFGPARNRGSRIRASS